MRVGITLPQFRPSAEPAIAAARAAESGGIDGVFVFDHVWAIGNPSRPARSAWPLLGALAGECDRIVLGTLVARVTLLPNAVLAHNVETLLRLCGRHRVIAGLGAGDHLSAAENDALDLPFPSVDARIEALADACRRTRGLGVTTWIGGLSKRIHRLAVTEADALNLWGVEPERVAEAAADVEVTWGGAAPANADATASLLRRLREAGATWAVLGPPYRAGGADIDPVPAVEMVAEALATLR